MIPIAHINGIPVEETVLALTPVLCLGFGAATAGLRVGVRRLRGRGGEVGARSQPIPRRDGF